MEEIRNINNIRICTEAFGNRNDPAILLIMGASASMLWWDEEFCRKLADKGRFVIRYDNRDVGRSTSYEPGTINYDVMDMVNDAFGVLDSYNIRKAHVAGMSLGGMIGQLMALLHADRVLTLTLIASSVWDDLPELPGISKKILDYHASGSSVNWTDENAVINYMTDGVKLLNGSKHPFDEQRNLELSKKEYHRANNLISMFNHALLKGGESYYGKAADIKIPTLVIHGTEDPVLPFEHAEALINFIPNSKLVTFEGRGHELHCNDWDEVITEIIGHTE